MTQITPIQDMNNIIINYFKMDVKEMVFRKLNYVLKEGQLAAIKAFLEGRDVFIVRLSQNQYHSRQLGP